MLRLHMPTVAFFKHKETLDPFIVRKAIFVKIQNIQPSWDKILNTPTDIYAVYIPEHPLFTTFRLWRINEPPRYYLLLYDDKQVFIDFFSKNESSPSSEQREPSFEEFLYLTDDREATIEDYERVKQAFQNNSHIELALTFRPADRLNIDHHRVEFISVNKLLTACKKLQLTPTEPIPGLSVHNTLDRMLIRLQRLIKTT